MLRFGRLCGFVQSLTPTGNQILWTGQAQCVSVAVPVCVVDAIVTKCRADAYEFSLFPLPLTFRPLIPCQGITCECFNTYDNGTVVSIERCYRPISRPLLMAIGFGPFALAIIVYILVDCVKKKQDESQTITSSPLASVDQRDDAEVSPEIVRQIIAALLHEQPGVVRRLPEGETCPICLAPTEGTNSDQSSSHDKVFELVYCGTKCGFPFHRACVESWLTGGGTTCPRCRAEWAALVSTSTPTAIRETRLNFSI